MILICRERPPTVLYTDLVAYLPQMFTGIVSEPLPDDSCALQGGNSQCYIASGGSFVPHTWVSLSAFIAK